MKEIQQQLIEYLKTLKVEACITGSALLPEYYEGSDIDVFCYNLKSFTKLYYTLKLNSMFQILEPLEVWKANMFENTENFDKNSHKGGVTTLKFTYNTCMPVNIILKKNSSNIFSVLSSFDINIIALGYDIMSKQYLDLSGDSHKTKIADINKWNPKYNSTEIWEISRVLRQFERNIKYHQRGFNTDNVSKEYLKIIDKLQEYQSIFLSESFNEKLQLLKDNTIIIKQIIEIWLKTHEISEKELELLRIKIREL